ncbi:class II fructose-bisphosphate aldolase [Thermoanaerobacterium thermosaccharolyticum]|uniref:class II fructose-bisphosphate aldolase n=1 Tax=Thermoanaerobacterium thermosaccharolyticum TaxID=1517 RepID=UPI003DA888A7
MLVTLNDVLIKAQREGYGIISANVFNMESVLAVFDSARKLKSPVIIACAERFDIEAIAEICKFYSKRFSDVVAVLHLDHGKSFENLIKAIKAGYTSVMIDASLDPFEENVRKTSEIVKIAHAAGVSVEGELGHVGRSTDYDFNVEDNLTQPYEALRFVKETSIDCLAVSIGTAHGLYKSTPKLDFNRLKEIRKTISLPLALHGGSSSGDENIRKAIDLGISKINIFTDLISSGGDKIKSLVEKGDNIDFVTACKEGLEGYKEVLIRYIKLFGSSNQA